MSIEQNTDRNGFCKKRPVVAFFNGNIHDAHSRTLISLIYEGFQEDNIDFHYYMGADLNGYLESSVTSNLRAAEHYYALFSYSAYDTPDIIILSMGGLTNADNSISVEEFVSHFPGIPVILLENNTVLPNIYHILIDNYGGMRAVMDHLIHDHGYKRIVHLAGPAKNNDARLRLAAYLDSLKENHLQESLVLHGDYTRNVDEQTEKLLDSRPEAIVSANDVMAGRVYQIAGERGIIVGRDIAVTGFDDIPTAAFMEPPLTTVRQDYSVIAREAVRQVHNYLEGRPLKDIALPASLVVRRSCGCNINQEESVLAHKRLIEHHEQIDTMIRQSMETAAMLRNMLFQEMDEQQIFSVIGSTLRRLGVVRSFVLLFEKPLKRNKREMVEAPPEIRMVLSQEKDSIKSYSLKDAPVVRKGGFREHIRTENRTDLTDFVLFYQKYEYGVLSVEIPPEQLLFFYSLSLEIGSGLRYLQISQDRNAVRNSLEEKNQILEYVALHDSLTGLYNRAGFMNEIFDYVRSYPSSDRFLMVMADLDHLKQINDCLGHNEGDCALRKVSEILHVAFPEGSIIGRNGGDEFIGVMHLPEGEEKGSAAEGFFSRIREECGKYDEEAGKPYFLGISAGVQEFGREDLGAIVHVIEKADRMLYEAKEKRRPYVLRNGI